MNRLIVVIFFLHICFSVYSISYYVNNTATGSNNGSSWTDAWTSFADINWNSINGGDTLFISGGSVSKTYNETLNITKAGTAGSNINIRVGQDSGHNGIVIIDSQLSRSECIYISKGYITIDGSYNDQIHLKLINAMSNGITSNWGLYDLKLTKIEIFDCGLPGQPGGFGYGIFLNAPKSSEVSYLEVHDNYKDGISIGDSYGSWGSHKIHHNHVYGNGDDGIFGMDGIDIYNNIIHDQTNWEVGHPDGIQVLGNYNRIYNNIIYNTANALIFVDIVQNSRRNGIAGDSMVFNNLLYQTIEPDYPYNYIRGIAIKGEPGITKLQNIVVANNTLADIAYVGILFTGADVTLFDNVTIANNIVHNCYSGDPSGEAISLSNSSYNNVVVDYNIVHEGTDGYSNMTWKGQDYTHSEFKANNLGQNNGFNVLPAFRSYSRFNSNNDFKIDSAADEYIIDKGISLSQYFTDDIQGNLREIWDIGCFEQTTAGNALTPVKPKSIEVE